MDLYALGEENGGARRVRFQLDLPEATRVDLLGGFTGWEPMPMARAGATWSLELSVPPGTHHFGFLVDGEWHVPDGAPGNVPDDWGRVNATLVVPPASQEP
jgi:1,4-alpha-glucan branching enzyme